jgi:hypothetical protein
MDSDVKYVIIIEEVSQGSDDQGHKTVHTADSGTIESINKWLTEKGFKPGRRDIWFRYGGFHNEQTATVLTVYSHLNF